MGALTWMVAMAAAFGARAAPGILWERVEGIYGANVRCLTATQDGALLAGTSAGLFRSENEGELWELSGFVDGSVSRLAAEGNVVYAGVEVDRRSRLHRSDDGGRTWDVTNLNFMPRGLAAQHGVVYGVWPFVGATTRVYRSEDSGETWTESRMGNARGVDVAATDAAVFAASANAVYRSANGQDGWEDVGPDLPDDRLVALATLGDTVYVAAEAGGVYRFDADSVTWTRTPLDGVDVEWMVATDGVLYVGTDRREFSRQPGVVRSEDGGATWVDMRIGEGAIATDAVVVGGREYVAGDGVFTLDPDGVSWRNVSRGMSDMEVFSVAVDGDQIYIGTESGVHVSDDAGGTWRHTDLYRGAPLLATDGGAVYAATCRQGLFRSDDLGRTWREINEGVPTRDTGSGVSYASSSPREILRVGERLYVAYYHGAFLSSQDGEAWEPVGGPVLEDGRQYFAFGDGPLTIGAHGAALYAVAHNFTTRSHDGGATWEPLWNAGSVRGSDLHTFDGRLYIAGERGVFGWDEGSRHWVDAMQGLPLGDEDDANDPERFAGTRFASLGRSLYVGSYTHGVHRLYAGTDKWMAAGLAGLRVWSLVAYDDGLLAGTSQGLLRATVDQNVAVEPGGKHATTWSDIKLAALTPEQNALLPSYPNPFNPETWIPFDLAAPSDVSVRIYNAAGGLVRALDLGGLRPGRYRERGRAAHWDGRDAMGAPVASGVYVVDLVAGTYSARRTIVVRK